MTKLRALSGIKPTGSPHWGNYFGMIQPAVALSKSYESFYFIADFHALTTVRDAEALRADSYQVAATLIAAGLDPESCVLWRQSDVPEVCELAWLLGCVTGYGLVERAHAFKDARANEREVNFGVVSYPVLMAADILLYDADAVPVGKDQVQHLEMTRDMVGYFNQQFLGSIGYDDDDRWDGKGLKRPEPIVAERAAVVPGLDGRKMSKSYDNYVPVFASPKQMKKRIMQIVTDSTPLEEPKDPTTCNVFAMYRLLATEAEVEALAAKYRGGNFGYGHAKLELLAVAERTFGPMRERYEALLADRDGLEAILQRGALQARAVAEPVLERVRAAVGLPLRPVR
ncbi:MAG: tryptophan--tRNA ligase [Deltaproteobacteria bacterium]|nr:tryptophan--tRNA ligase [Deltaproteobacteria bacterium]